MIKIDKITELNHNEIETSIIRCLHYVFLLYRIYGWKNKEYDQVYNVVDLNHRIFLYGLGDKHHIYTICEILGKSIKHFDDLMLAKRFVKKDILKLKEISEMTLIEIKLTSL